MSLQDIIDKAVKENQIPDLEVEFKAAIENLNLEDWQWLTLIHHLDSVLMAGKNANAQAQTRP
jgi:hypothetical protein